VPERGIHEHRTAKKHWFHYFFDENLVFHSEPISYLKAKYYKPKKVKEPKPEKVKKNKNKLVNLVSGKL